MKERFNLAHQYTYDDIFLVPRYSEISSRSDADTSVTYTWNYQVDIWDNEKYGGAGPRTLRRSNPIISANMDTVTEWRMATTMWNAGGMGALHRFLSIEDNVIQYTKVKESGADCFVSIGTSNKSKERAEALYNAGARYFIIDIAHGHSKSMLDMIYWLRSGGPGTTPIYIVAGNVATAEGVNDLAVAGVDAVKVGIGGGSVCTTRIVTGHGVPTFSCLLDCCAVADDLNIKIIADGGIRASGDIVKAFAAGADYVMIGSLLAGADEAPGEDYYVEHQRYKKYRGMSSKEVIKETRSDEKFTPVAEGVALDIPCTGPALITIAELVGGLKSGMSYCDATTISEIYTNTHWGVQTGASITESTPHKLRK